MSCRALVRMLEEMKEWKNMPTGKALFGDEHDETMATHCWACYGPFEPELVIDGYVLVIPGKVCRACER